MAAKVIVSGALLITSVCWTSAAAVWLASPACLAVITVEPTLTICKVLPFTVATAVFELVKVTGIVLLLLVATNVKSASPKVFAGSGLNVMADAPIGLMFNTCCTLIAALWLASPAWLAVTTVAPAPTIWTVLPHNVATVVFELVNVTGTALLVLVALILKSESFLVF